MCIYDRHTRSNLLMSTTSADLYIKGSFGMGFGTELGYSAFAARNKEDRVMDIVLWRRREFGSI
jgi:hypothetical protein